MSFPMAQKMQDSGGIELIALQSRASGALH